MEINHKRLKELVLILWDNREDFEDEKTQKRLTQRLFKTDKAYRCYSKDEFLEITKQFEANQEYLFFIHLAHTKDQQGYYQFTDSGILEEFPNIKRYYITRSDISEVVKTNKLGLDIFSWENYQSKIDKMFLPQTVAQMKQEKETSNNLPSNNPNRPPIKYAIFTALWDEFKEVEELFDWKEELQEETKTIVYKIGKLKGTEKYVVGCFAGKTGMTEAAVICSELINRYTPEYLLMPGVCGGSDKTEFGDVIVANKVFLLGKGKIKDNKEEIEGRSTKAILHYNEKPIDISKITNAQGKSVRLVSEVFEKEIETIYLDEKLSQKLEPKLKEIEGKINNPYKMNNEKIKVRFDPMACSLSVIDKEDYFEFEIKERDRKTKAVEMESYGVARAAQKANGGETKFLIFKSVMDKASSKTDQYKEKAAYTSAQFLKHLLKENII
ncbi:MAG: nucleoside phosphorylase [Psychroserpens sp.]|jgi:nucleoside phosphorylase